MAKRDPEIVWCVVSAAGKRSRFFRGNSYDGLRGLPIPDHLRVSFNTIASRTHEFTRRLPRRLPIHWELLK